MKVADELEMTKLVADEMDRIVAEQTRRIRALEATLREIVFKCDDPEGTRIVGTVRHLAAMALGIER